MAPGATGALRVAMAVLVLAIPAFAALAIGAVHDTTRTVVFVASALLLLLVLFERLLEGRRLTLAVPAVALAVAAAATALQLVPLPPGVVRFLSPAAAEIHAGLDEAGLLPLSLDPPATLRELAKICAYLAFFVAAVSYASRGARRRMIVVGIAGLATVVAIIGLAQAALGVGEVLFFYKPRAEWATFVRGTFVNPNHFGGLLAVGAPCALAIALRPPDARLRWAAGAAAVILNVAVMLSLARASIAAVLIGQALVFALDRLELTRGGEFLRSRGATLGTLAVAVVAAIGIAMVTGRSRLAAVAAQTADLSTEMSSPLSKVGVWRSSVDLVWGYPWTGVGRGAFEPAFTQVAEVGGVLRYQWVENGYLEALVDWGVPVATLLFLLAGLSLLVARRRLREDPLALGAFAAVIALAIHEAADFSVELPGVALPALAVLATLYGRSGRDTSRPTRLSVSALALAVPFILVAPAIAALHARTAEQDAEHLQLLAHDRSVPTQRVIAEGDAARRRHPADYFIRLVVAERLAREQHPQSLRWLNEAMLLNPTHPAPHLMAAETLAANGHKPQALLEYRLAAAGARDPRGEVWRYVAQRYPGLDDLYAATPENESAQLLLARWLGAIGRRDDAEKVFVRMLEREPHNVRALDAAARLALARRDAAAARRHIDALAALQPGPEIEGLRARERILAGDLDVAARLIDSMARRNPDGFDLELELASAYAGGGHADIARKRLDGVSRWHLDRQARARLHELRAEIERREGNEHQYHWELEQRDRYQKH